jgi:predicted flap endonuclease-1-like 5' DNA nuclease
MLAPPIVKEPSKEVKVSDNSYIIAGTSVADTLVQVLVAYDLPQKPRGTLVRALQLTGGMTSYSITVPLTQSVANKFVVIAKDAAGNISPATAVPTITQTYDAIRAELEKIELSEIEGIGEARAQKFKDIGISTVADLLEAGSSPSGRKQLAEKTEMDEQYILGLVNRSDLFRVKGVGEEYTDLLVEAGVNTVPELAQRNSEHLSKKLREVNKDKSLVGKLPTSSQIKQWVEQAKTLPVMITY